MKIKNFTVALALAATTVLTPAVAYAEDLVLSIGSRGYGQMVERNLEQ